MSEDRALKIIRHHSRYFTYLSCYDPPALAADVALEVYNLVPKDQDALKSWIEDVRKTLDAPLTLDAPSSERCLFGAGGWDGINLETWDVLVSYVYEINLDAGVFCYQGLPAFHLAHMPPAHVFRRICEGLQTVPDSLPREQDDAWNLWEEWNRPVCTCAFYGAVADEPGEVHFLSAPILRRLTPATYRFDLAQIWPPALPAAPAAPDAATPPAALTVSLAEIEGLLGLTPQLARAEDLCLHLLRDCAVIYMQRVPRVLFEAFALGGTLQTADAACVARHLAAMALLPFTAMCPPQRGPAARGRPRIEVAHGAQAAGEAYLAALVAQAGAGEFWFPRRHICYTLATHLLDAGCARYHVDRVVRRIMIEQASGAADMPDIVYGVLFSVFHVVIVRVERDAGGVVVVHRTGVMEFLPPVLLQRLTPDACGPAPPTPGMRLMTRLGHARAADDVRFFHAALGSRSQWRRYMGDSRITADAATLVDTSALGASAPVHGTPAAASTQNTTARVQPVLSADVLSVIAGHLYAPQTLCAFALASQATMAAALPRLRYPQYTPADAAGPCPQGGIVSSRAADAKHTEWLPTVFRVAHVRASEAGLGTVCVQLTTRQGLHADRALRPSPAVVARQEARDTRDGPTHLEDLHSWARCTGSNLLEFMYDVWSEGEQ